MSDMWTDKLSEYLDGHLAEQERKELEAHLVVCEHCSHVLRQLEDVKRAAADLEDRPPSVDLWQGVATRLRDASAGRTEVLELPERRVTPARRFQFTLPQLMAAGVVLAVLSGAAGYLARPEAGTAYTTSPEVAAVPGTATAVLAGFQASEYDAVVAELQQILEQGRSQLDPSTVAVLDRSLATIDRAIAEAQEALRDDPSNSYLSAHLTNTMNRKIRLLRHAASLATAAS